MGSASVREPLILIANRGEIARRVIKTCDKLGLRTLSVYTQADALAPHAREASVSVYLGEDPRSYTNIPLLLEVAKSNGVTAVHPGYGFLSENDEFCEAIEAAGIAWLGPNSTVMRSFALKHVARELAENAGVPILKGSPLLTEVEDAVTAAQSVGYPVLIKATGGGGGRGIFMCSSDDDVRANFATSQHQGQAFFGNSGVFVEKYISKGHHVEVQIFGDGEGNCVHLGERECSIQRRHQKVLEETPSPTLDDDTREKLALSAVQLAKAAKYRSAGTVEFLYDEDTNAFYFLEVNTRLQVEHGITELVNGGVDLVEWQLRLQVPSLPPLDLSSVALTRTGWSIEVRLNGEDPAKDFAPSPGLLGEVSLPHDMEGVRVDSWVETGCEVSPHYDSLLGKLMVWAPTREEAVQRMLSALEATRLKGVPTNLEFLRQLVADEGFKAGLTTTRFLDTFHFQPRLVEVLAPGLQTSVQDWPGRVALWHVGVPPSGPMDALALRVANALVGNAGSAAGLEFSLAGPTLRFHSDALLALTGAEFSAALDGVPLTWWSSVAVKAGQTLNIGAVKGNMGARGYLALSGGIDVPVYLGSRSTFPGGQFGGYQGRYLRCGDSLPVGTPDVATAKPTALPQGWKEKYAGAVHGVGYSEEGVWQVGVLPGPHAAPDYFTEEAIEVFYSTDYQVHYNSNRLGVRLDGPRPTWARADGGEGGSHPSNVHDHVYAMGTVNFTGDMPVILTQDGPSLGGFVCAATVLSTELWKVGQMRPHDKLRFVHVDLATAHAAVGVTDALVAAVTALARGEVADAEEAEKGILAALAVPVPEMPPTRPLLKRIEPHGSHPGVEYRLAGDRYVQIEYGPMTLDLTLRARVHALEEWFKRRAHPGVVETNPGVRSCMIEYEPRLLPLPDMLALLELADSELPDVTEMELPSRILHLPMAFEEKWTAEAIVKYMKSVRSEAPYLPSNVDYMAKNNGLDSKEQVRSTIFDASYLVLGLGDVYLGAPCAVPVDPRHRLVTTKYNPARTFTAEGTVGIGGSYMCVYPMDSPGGYQLVGRTLPIWNTFGRSGPFTPDKPWLLEFFDQVRFFQVGEDELVALRGRFSSGHYELKIEQSTFKLKEYNEMVKALQPEVDALQAQQRAAMAVMLQEEGASLARLQAAKDAGGDAAVAPPIDDEDESVFDKPEYIKVQSGFTANVWEVRVEVGQEVAADDVLVVLEAMKMESPVHAPVPGTVRAVRVSQGQLAPAGSLLVVLEVKA